MFKMWLYQPKHYLMAILMVVCFYALTLEELTYWFMGQTTTVAISDVVEESLPERTSRVEKTFNRNQYSLKDGEDDSTVESSFFGAGYKVGDSVEIQFISGWGAAWSRPSWKSKPWLGWGGLAITILIGLVGYHYGKEASDPFAKAREERYRQRREA